MYKKPFFEFFTHFTVIKKKIYLLWIRKILFSIFFPLYKDTISPVLDKKRKITNFSCALRDNCNWKTSVYLHQHLCILACCVYFCKHSACSACAKEIKTDFINLEMHFFSCKRFVLLKLLSRMQNARKCGGQTRLYI